MYYRPGSTLAGNMGCAVVYNQYPVGYASTWRKVESDILRSCCVCTSEVALQHCSLCGRGVPRENGLQNQNTAGLCDLDDSPLCPLQLSVKHPSGRC